jgi:glutamate formiminotransferase
MGTVPARTPDVGDAGDTPDRGRRRFLIACNLNLAIAEVDTAKKIANVTPCSTSGFRYVRSIRIMLEAGNQGACATATFT